MANPTPNDVIKVLQMTINFMDITLLGENLSPSADMERQETIERLNMMIEKLGNMKETGFVKAQAAEQSKPTNKFWKTEKKVEKPARQVSTMSTGSAYVDMNDGGKSSPKVESKGSPKISSAEHAEKENLKVGEEDDDDDYELPTSKVEQTKTTMPDVAAEESTISYEALTKKVKIFENCSPTELKASATYSGYLTKHKKRVLTKWHRRYCILKDEFLFYFKSETDNKETGVIILPGYMFTVPPKDKGFLFVLESHDKSRDNYMFQAEYQEDLEQWRKHICAITSKTLTSSQMGMVNQVAGEHQEKDSNDGSGSARVEDICGELYDDVAVSPSDPPQELYDDVALANEPAQELYDDVQSDMLPPPPTELLPEEPEETAGEMYELIPGQMNQNVPTSAPPAPLPGRSPLHTPAVENAHIPPRRPTQKGAPPIPPTNTSPMHSTPADKQFTMENIYLGLYDCAGQDKDDLSFKRGDILYKLEEIDMNWWVGYLNGKCGLVPSNFLVEAFS